MYFDVITIGLACLMGLGFVFIIVSDQFGTLDITEWSIIRRIKKSEEILKQLYSQRDFLKEEVNIEDINDRLSKYSAYVAGLKRELNIRRMQRCFERNRDVDVLARLEQEIEVSDLKIDDDFEKELLMYAEKAKLKD